MEEREIAARYKSSTPQAAEIWELYPSSSRESKCHTNFKRPWLSHTCSSWPRISQRMESPSCFSKLTDPSFLMHTFFFFLIFIFLTRSIVDLYYCVSFRCAAKWLRFKYIKYVYYISAYTYITYLIFIAVLFTIAKTWKQQKCPSTDEWIKKTWNIYTMENYSSIEKWNSAICSNMNGPRQYHWGK